MTQCNIDGGVRLCRRALARRRVRRAASGSCGRALLRGRWRSRKAAEEVQRINKCRPAVQSPAGIVQE